MYVSSPAHCALSYLLSHVFLSQCPLEARANYRIYNLSPSAAVSSSELLVLCVSNQNVGLTKELEKKN